MKRLSMVFKWLKTIGAASSAFISVIVVARNLKRELQTVAEVGRDSALNDALLSGAGITNKGDFMKNEEMKVTDLLNEKVETERKINSLNRQLEALNRETGSESFNCDKCPTVEIYAHSRSYRSRIDSDLLVVAVESQIERLEKELEPIVKKLDAIELMLNS